MKSAKRTDGLQNLIISTYLFFLHFQFSVFGSKFSLENALHYFFTLVLQSRQLVIPLLGLLLPVDLLLDVLDLPIRVLNL